MNVDTLQFDKLPELGSGSECTVYDLGDGTCYKSYFSFIDIETIYHNAEIAYEFGIGPEVYECGEHGYRTEIVEQVAGLCNRFDCIDCDDCDIAPRTQRQELKIKAVELFGERATVDLHVHNIGLKNGKMILIDFGDSSEFSVE